MSVKSDVETELHFTLSEKERFMVVAPQFMAVILDIVGVVLSVTTAVDPERSMV
ncbi:MAG: hypothetical protein BWY67_01817 [Bacteroidetes bacterium ADurb.Bin397]|nr:MAG: hypothetical protein BWY67_01817 [Bacteroidetes bacterium ADurb.Bin397]